MKNLSTIIILALTWSAQVSAKKRDDPHQVKKVAAITSGLVRSLDEAVFEARMKGISGNRIQWKDDSGSMMLTGIWRKAEYYCDVKVTFHDARSADGDTITNGSCRTIVSESGPLKRTHTGAFTVIFRKISYRILLDISFVYKNSSDFSYSGTVTLDGTAYDYADLVRARERE